MSIYQRGKNWYIDFTFKGQGIRESIGPSRKGAEKVISKKKAEIAENKYLDRRKEPDPIKFYDFAKEYLAKRVKHNTNKAESYRRTVSLMRQLSKVFDSRKLHEITQKEIESYQANRREKVKPATVNREVALLKHMFTKAMEWGKVEDSPAKKVKLLKGEVKRVRYLMPDEIQSLLSNCTEHLRAIVTVALHTGMRKGELLNLKREQVNFKQGFISLTDTKNGERRDIPMDETVKATLESIENKGSYFFTDKKGNSFKDVKKAFGTALTKTGIKDFRFHDLRHTFASNLVMAGVELNIVGDLLGHKTPTMTKRYSHLSPAYKKRVVSILDEIMKPQDLEMHMSQNPPQSELIQKGVSLIS